MKPKTLYRLYLIAAYTGNTDVPQNHLPPIAKMIEHELLACLSASGIYLYGDIETEQRQS